MFQDLSEVGAQECCQGCYRLGYMFQDLSEVGAQECTSVLFLRWVWQADFKHFLSWYQVRTGEFV